MKNSILILFIVIPLITIYDGVAQEDGKTYFIESALGTFLDVKEANSSPRTPVWMWKQNKGEGQKWTLSDTGDGYFYIQSGLGTYLDIKESNSGLRAHVWTWSNNGSKGQKWRFEPAEDGFFYIQSALGTYLDIKGGNPDTRAQVWTWKKNGGKGQKWKLQESTNEFQQINTTQSATVKNLTLTSEKVALQTIINLCPRKLVGGDLEFGGNGPEVFGSVTLWKGDDNKHIYAHINFNAQETKSDFLTGRSEVQGSWKIPVYTAPEGKKINGIVSTDVTTNFNKVLRGGGANETLGGGSDGSSHILTVGNGLDGNGYVNFFKVVGDTGGWDISRDDDCTNDTRILEIQFKPIEIEFYK
ncbi:RICIN domain-containing protein [Zobellia sp.]|nr:RICIN domain-containing protein [Zobellia sp.]